MIRRHQRPIPIWKLRPSLEALLDIKSNSEIEDLLRDSVNLGILQVPGYFSIKHDVKREVEPMKSSGNCFLVQKRKLLNFFCPRCQKLIRAPSGADVIKSFLQGKMTREAALRLRILAHFRHKHTEYDFLAPSSKIRLRMQYDREALQLIDKDGGFDAIIMEGRQK